MNLIFQAAKEICDFMDARGWRFCLIGGLAVQRWGEPRTTLDADFTLFVEFGDEEEYVRAILSQFESRIANAEQFAISRRVLLIRASNGIGIDIALGALPFESEMIGRAGRVEFAPGIELPCCTAEDLFVMKVFAGRPRDLGDAKSIVARENELDIKYILARVRELSELRESTEILETARKFLEAKA